jgi:hypothetical protein
MYCSDTATHKPKVCELCVMFRKWSGMGDPATSKFVIKGVLYIQSVTYMPVHLSLYSPLIFGTKDCVL